MGVSKIGIYNGSVSSTKRLEKILNHYTKDGILDFRQINTGGLFYEENRKVEAFKLSSPASLNDCMMRYAGVTRWVVMLDFDELIIPTDAIDFANLMKRIYDEERNRTLQKEVKKLKEGSIVFSIS